MLRRRSPTRRSIVTPLYVVVALLVAGGSWWGFVSLGRLLYHEDPLEKSDVIFVLAGTRLERAAEAGHLYLEGWAPRILLSRQESDGAEIALRRQGFDIPTENDYQTAMLVRMGVPPSAISSVDDEQSATATEARALFEQSGANTWRSIIVVTSKLHTARARLALGRIFDPSVRIIMRGSRYDRSNVDEWWKSRGSFRFVLFEAQKLLAYWVGLAD